MLRKREKLQKKMEWAQSLLNKKHAKSGPAHTTTTTTLKDTTANDTTNADVNNVDVEVVNAPDSDASEDLPLDDDGMIMPSPVFSKTRSRTRQSTTTATAPPAAAAATSIKRTRKTLFRDTPTGVLFFFFV